MPATELLTNTSVKKADNRVISIIAYANKEFIYSEALFITSEHYVRVRHPGPVHMQRGESERGQEMILKLYSELKENKRIIALFS